MLKSLVLGVLGLLLAYRTATATTCTTYPNPLTNGTTADGSQVIVNLTYMSGCLAPQANPALTGNAILIAANTGVGFYIQTANTTFSNAIAVQSPAATEQAAMAFLSNASVGWQVGKNADNSFFIWDTAAARNDLQIGSSGNMFLMQGGGNVGIGTTSPALPLTVLGNVRIGASGTLGCVQNFAGTALTGTCTSDGRLKDVTGSVIGVLEKFGRLQLVRYRWNRKAAVLYHNSTSVLNTGFIAQAVQAQFPELVSFDSKGYRRLDYTTLSLYGLEAIKELKAENEKQATALSENQQRDQREIRALSERLNSLERRMNIRSAQR